MQVPKRISAKGHYDFAESRSDRTSRNDKIQLFDCRVNKGLRIVILAEAGIQFSLEWMPDYTPRA
jgi:hypothetical protein